VNAPIIHLPGLNKSKPVYIGPRGGKWSDPKHTVHWTPDEPGRYRKDEQAREKHIKGARRALVELLPDAQSAARTAKAIVAASPKTAPDVGYLTVQALKSKPSVMAYLDKWIGPEVNSHVKSWRASTLYALRDHLARGAGIRETTDKIATLASKGFQAREMHTAQAPLKAVVPKELLAFLPKNIVVDADATGEISRITDRFENERETLGNKIAKMHRLVRDYNAIAARVKTDLGSDDEKTKLAATVTAIIMETGIRPGKEGNEAIKTVEGEKIPVETFGAITLGPGHVKFVRDNFAELEFVGKKGGINTASLTDEQIVGVLRDYTQRALTNGSKFIFVTKDGTPFDYTDLQRYFREHFDGFAPTDFRKLKATREMLGALEAEQGALYDRIRSFADGKVADLKQRITDEIVRTLDAAIGRAAASLSHASESTTRESYINPQIVFQFLSTGRVTNDLKAAILEQKHLLKFDPEVFVRMALEHSGTMSKAKPVYIGPRGGKWADPKHTISWTAEKKRTKREKEKPKPVARIPDAEDHYEGTRDQHVWPHEVVIKRGMSLSQAEDAIRHQPIEHALVVGPTGSHIARLRGQAGACEVPAYVVINSRMARDYVFTHNHPTGGVLSPEDVLCAIHGNFREMRAVRPDGSVWSLSRGKADNWYENVKPVIQPGLTLTDLAMKQAKMHTVHIAIEHAAAAALTSGFDKMNAWMIAHGAKELSSTDPVYSQEKWIEYINEAHTEAFAPLFAKFGWEHKLIPAKTSDARGDAEKRNRARQEHQRSLRPSGEETGEDLAAQLSAGFDSHTREPGGKYAKVTLDNWEEHAEELAEKIGLTIRRTYEGHDASGATHIYHGLAVSTGLSGLRETFGSHPPKDKVDRFVKLAAKRCVEHIKARNPKSDERAAEYEEHIRYLAEHNQGTATIEVKLLSSALSQIENTHEWQNIGKVRALEVMAKVFPKGSVPRPVKKHSLTVERVGDRSYVTGKTFAVKDELRAAGGRWDPDRKAWWFSNHEAASKFSKSLSKARPVFIGPRGGKWADPKHTQHWEPDAERAVTRKEKPKSVVRLPPLDQDAKYVGPIKKGMSLHATENVIRHESREHALIMRAGGGHVSRIRGVKHSVHFSPEVMNAARADGNCVFTHNHPGAGTLSPADILCAAYMNVTEVRAVRPDGGVWSLKRGINKKTGQPARTWHDNIQPLRRKPHAEEMYFPRTVNLEDKVALARIRMDVMDVSGVAEAAALKLMDAYMQKQGVPAGYTDHHGKFNKEKWNAIQTATYNEVYKQRLLQKYGWEFSHIKPGATDVGRSSGARHGTGSGVQHPVRAIGEQGLIAAEPGNIEKARPIYIGPRGGKWADPRHTQSWTPSGDDPSTSRNEDPGSEQALITRLEKKIRRRKPGQGDEVHLNKAELLHLLDSGKYALLSAGPNPNIDAHKNMDPVEQKFRHAKLRTELMTGGWMFTPVTGHYGGREDSYLVMIHDANRADARKLGETFDQDSIIYAENGRQEMHYTTGDNHRKNLCLEGAGWEHKPKAKDFFTSYQHPDGAKTRFSLRFDWSNPKPCKGDVKKSMWTALEALEKACGDEGPDLLAKFRGERGVHTTQTAEEKGTDKQSMKREMSEEGFDKQDVRDLVGKKTEFPSHGIEPLDYPHEVGPYVGPKGGKWADPRHTVPWRGMHHLAKKEHFALMSHHLHAGEKKMAEYHWARGKYHEALQAKGDTLPQEMAASLDAIRDQVLSEELRKSGGLFAIDAPGWPTYADWLAKAARPPGGGWHTIPHGRKGGFRKRVARGWEYWYPSSATAATTRQLRGEGLPKPTPKPKGGREALSPLAKVLPAFPHSEADRKSQPGLWAIEHGVVPLARVRTYERAQDGKLIRTTKRVPEPSDQVKLQLLDEFSPLIRKRADQAERGFILKPRYSYEGQRRINETRVELERAGAEGLLRAIRAYKGKRPFARLANAFVTDYVRFQSAREFQGGFEMPDLHMRNMRRYIAARVQARHKFKTDDPTPAQIAQVWDLRLKHVHMGVAPYRRQDPIPLDTRYKLQIGLRGAGMEDPDVTGMRDVVWQPSRIEWAQMYDSFLRGQSKLVDLEEQGLFPGLGIGVGMPIEDQITHRAQIDEAMNAIGSLGSIAVTLPMGRTGKPQHYRVKDVKGLMKRRLGIHPFHEHSVRELAELITTERLSPVSKKWEALKPRTAHTVLQAVIESAGERLKSVVKRRDIEPIVEQAVERVAPKQMLPAGRTYGEALRAAARDMPQEAIDAFKKEQSDKLRRHAKQEDALADQEQDAKRSLEHRARAESHRGGADWFDRMSNDDASIEVAKRSEVMKKYTRAMREAMTRHTVIERTDATGGIAWAVDPSTGKRHSFRVSLDWKRPKMKHPRAPIGSSESKTQQYTITAQGKTPRTGQRTLSEEQAAQLRAQGFGVELHKGFDEIGSSGLREGRDWPYLMGLILSAQPSPELTRLQLRTGFA
jgi:hypothetical protein